MNEVRMHAIKTAPIIYNIHKGLEESVIGSVIWYTFTEEFTSADQP